MNDLVAAATRVGRKLLAAGATIAVVGTCSGTAMSGGPLTAPGAAGRLCSKAAAPSGNDGALGTIAHPFATVTRLVGALRPGQTGCLLRGRFKEDVVASRKATATAPITLTAAPGADVTICGHLEFTHASNYWTASHLNIDGKCSSQITVQVLGDNVHLIHNDITNEHLSGSCVILGSLQYGLTHNAVVDHNRIHGCGAPSGAPYHHGVYDCCGYNSRVTNNIVYDNTGYGIQLYPDADNALVANNVVDSNDHLGGIFFGGDVYGSCYATDNASVRNNIVTNNGGFGIRAWWGCKAGTGNRASRNCLWANKSGAVDPETVGFTAYANLKANPRFVALKNRDYRLRSGSRCRAMGPRGPVGP